MKLFQYVTEKNVTSHFLCCSCSAILNVFPRATEVFSGRVADDNC